MQGETLEDTSVHMTGIKGSGMVALAEILCARGASVRGTDTAERFYTDEILAGLNVELIEGFDAAHVRAGTDVLYYSAAYDPETHPELVRARELSIPCFTYNEALGRFSESADATGIAGVHGKSTSTAIAGVLVRELGLPATVVVGSMVPDFGNRAASVSGEAFFIAETCEYRRHFLAFQPDRLMVTSIEADHLDYFQGYEDIFTAFEEYASQLSYDGLLVYCADDPGACDLAARIAAIRPDVRCTPYGVHAEGRFRVESTRTENEQVHFKLSGFSRSLSLSLPGEHNAVNTAGVLALIEDILPADVRRREESGKRQNEPRIKPDGQRPVQDGQRPVQDGQRPVQDGQRPVQDDQRHGPDKARPVQDDHDLPGSPLSDAWERISRALSGFRGLKRRSERIGEAGGVTILDDYAHHPTAITAEIQALRQFFPDRRLVVDFMSHTYSRTAALLDDFAQALSEADVLVLHRIYASAREVNSRGVRGEHLADAVVSQPQGARLHSSSVYYIDDPLDAVDTLETILRPGDVFVTMGAGDNWRVGKALLERRRTRT